MKKLVTVLWAFFALMVLIFSLFVYRQYKEDQFHQTTITKILSTIDEQNKNEAQFRSSSIAAMNQQNLLLDSGNKILTSHVNP